MNEETFKSIAEQLRQPNGELAIEVGKKMNEANFKMNIYTIETLKIEENDTILEIGMGNGFFVKNLFHIEQNINYTGCDFSEEMVEEATKLNSQYIENGKANFITANANKIPYGNKTFNKIFTINTIYFWDDIGLVLSEIKRLLKEMGHLIIAIRPKSIMDNFPISQYGFTTFSKSGIKTILEENGFKVVEIIEKKEDDIEFFGKTLENAFMIIKAIV